MPKVVVGIVSVAFALVIGFACGALLTAPKNSIMEGIVNENKVLEKDVNDFKDKVQLLQKDVEKLNETNGQLKDRLLQLYNVREKSSSTSVK